MYPAGSNRNHHQFLLALASDGSVIEELLDFLIGKRDEYREKLQSSAIAALDDKLNVPYALRQAGAVDALEDLIFILSSYRKSKELK